MKEFNRLIKKYQDPQNSKVKRKESRSKTLKLLRYRASKGDNESQYLLGILYSDDSCNDIGIPPKKNRAFYWYKKACENNNPYACHNLAYFFEEGVIVPKNESKEIMLYKKAYGLGLSESGYALYVLHKQRNRLKEAIEWLEKVVNSDSQNGEAYVEYAKLLVDGKLLRKDYKKAQELITKAILSKNITQYTYEEAIYMIGLMYFKGFNLKKDLVLGKYLILMANKDQDHPEISEFTSRNKSLFDKIVINGDIEIPPNLIF